MRTPRGTLFFSTPSRTALAVATAIGLGGAFACGDDSAADDDPTQPAKVHLESTCSTDVDCMNGGRCENVAPDARACVSSKSCTGGPGADETCGSVRGNEDSPGGTSCCEARLVPGGTYHPFNDDRFTATVSPFLLDTFEVTAGRFRAWVEATNGNLRASAPSEGEGAHPKIPDSGWRSEWNALLPTNREEVDEMFGPESCQVGSNVQDYGALTWWTDELDRAVRAANDSSTVLSENTKARLDTKPINCIPWEVLFAFCVWDGGRLPTNAEWGFAASAGDEQRAFPWGNPADEDLVFIDGRDDLSRTPTYAAGRDYTVAALFDPSDGKPNLLPDSYLSTWGGPIRETYDNATHIAPVGRKALGNGKWGHADLAGNIHEWMLDEGPVRPGTCTDCANVSWPKSDAFDPDVKEGIIPEFEHRWFAGGARVIRGGAWDNAFSLANGQSPLEINAYTSYPVRRTYRALGGRCARDR